MATRIAIARNVQNHNNGALVVEITTADVRSTAPGADAVYQNVVTHTVHVTGPNGELAPGAPIAGAGVTLINIG